MDMRLMRNEVPNPIKLIQKSVLIVDRPLSDEETLAFLDEFFIQTAIWQGETA